MPHVPYLISDLAVILCTAGFVTLLFKALKQPVVLGYIVAGILTGPTAMLLPAVSDIEAVKIWADIGVIFLLFALGLDFSFKKIFRVGGTAVISAVVITIGMMSLGYVVGYLLGWSHINSLFLGGMISMSSTTIVFKALEDLGLRNKRFAGVVLGVLVVEDLVAVVLMVLLSTVSIGYDIEGMELVDSILMLGSFLLFWSVMGIFLVPSLLRKVKRLLNDETLLIVSLGLCLGMVLLATSAGFSAALGAFVMGSILAETVDAEKIEHLIKPVKNLFGAVFFVSVGMMIQPTMLVDYGFPIFVITLTVLFGQIFFSTFGILLSGQPLRVSIQSGFSLCQIGEFAFIIAGLGLSLHVISDFLYPVVVAVSVLTTFLTPYMIKLADPVNKMLENYLPKKWLLALDRYSATNHKIASKGAWRRLLKSLLINVVLYTVLSLFVIYLFFKYITPYITFHISGVWGNIISLILLLIVISPFLRAIMVKKNRSQEYRSLWKHNKYNRFPLLFLILLRVMLCIAIVIYLIAKLTTVATGFIFFIASLIIILFYFSQHLKKHSIKLEKSFLKNFMAREDAAQKAMPIRKEYVSHMLTRALHLSHFIIYQESPSIGKTLKELNFRQVCGVSVVSIIRGAKRINIPSGKERLYPFDKLIVVGTDDDLQLFRAHIDAQEAVAKQHAINSLKEVVLKQFVIEEDSVLRQKTLKESGIRDVATCLVVGIERSGESIMNPPSTIIFEKNDVVWVVGEEDQLISLSNK